MRKINLNSNTTGSIFTKGLMIVSALVVMMLALVGSFYLLVAALVIGLSASLLSAAKGKPQPVKVKANRQPLDAEYRVVRRK